MDRSTFLYNAKEWDSICTPGHARRSYGRYIYPWDDAEKTKDIPLGFAICITTVCVRREYDVKSGFIAKLKEGTCLQ